MDATGAYFRTGFMRYTFTTSYSDFTYDGDSMKYFTDKRFGVTGVHCPNYEEWYMTAIDDASNKNYLVSYKWGDGNAKYWILNSHDTLHFHGHISSTSGSGMPVTGYYVGGTT